MRMKFDFITMDQPAGRFYISKIKADILISISQSDTRTPYNSTGIQRKLNNDRVSDIAKYCNMENAMFPTPIILSANSEYFTFYSDQDENSKYPDSNNLNKNNEFRNIESGSLEIDVDKIIEDKKFLSIVDGQHRLAGIKESGIAKEFDLLAMFIFDTQAYQDAEIFSIINRNQKQVSKSLVYDLYGLTDEMTVEKFSHEIVKALNTVEYSLLKDRIKMLGYKTDTFNEKNKQIRQYVSQAAIIDELIRMISRDITKDNDFVKKGEAISNPEGNNQLILRKFFYDDNLFIIQAIMIGFYNAWIEALRIDFEEDTIIFKTVGFIASLMVFKYLYNNSDIDKKLETISVGNNYNMNYENSYIDENLINIFKEHFKLYIRELDFKSINIKEISSSRSGAMNIYSILTRTLKDKEKLKS